MNLFGWFSTKAAAPSSSSFFLEGLSSSLPQNIKAYAKEGYSENPIVFACASIIANAAASVKLELHSYNDEGDKKVAVTGPLLDRMAHPNPMQTWEEFATEMVAWHRVAGEIFILRLPEKGKAAELHVLNPDLMHVEPGKGNVPKYYEMDVAGSKIRYPVNQLDGTSQILHIKTFNPNSKWRGLSPLSPAARSTDIHNNGTKWNSNLLLNSARPSGVIEVQGTVDESTLSKLREYFKKAWQGVLNASTLPILTGGMKFTPLSITPKDMDFEKNMAAAAKDMASANSVTTSEETIFMVVNIPTTMVGTTDYYIANGATYGFSRLSGGTMDFRATGSNAGTQALRGVPLCTLDQPIILSGRRSAVQNAIAMFENGALLKQDTHTGGSRSGTFVLGLLTGSTYGDFTVGATLIYNRYVTEDERLNLDEWLATRFSVYTPFANIRTLYPASRRYAAKNNVTDINTLPSKKIIYAWGQSNMAGGALNSAISANITIPVPGGYIWNPTNTAVEQLTLANNLSESPGNNHGPEMALMFDMGADFPGAIIVKSATGNTSMATRWLKTGDLYLAWVQRIKDAMDKEGFANGTRFQVAGIVGAQGEFDSDDNANANNYYANFSGMILDFRSRVWGAATAPWVHIQTKLTSPPNPTAYATVVAAQQQVAVDLPNVSIAAPWTSSLDGIHGTADSIRVISNAVALVFGATTQVS